MKVHSKRWVIFAVLSAAVVLGTLILTALAIWLYSPARMAVRWLLWSRDYKSAVLSQPTSSNRDLKHIEWDGWGWAGENTIVYLVYEPTNSLSTAASTGQSGKFAGIPCEVPSVRRLESDWYIVTFYTGQKWGRCK